MEDWTKVVKGPHQDGKYLPPLPTYRPGSESPPETSKTPPGDLSKRERDDSYSGLVFYINKKWRVVVCKDGFQWILQQRKGPNQWRGRKFFARKEHMYRAFRELFGKEVFLSFKDKIDSLPI